MTLATGCLKWVNVLETQFDKSWVDLDLLFNQIDEDEDEILISPTCRKHAASLASCFSQLAHKSTVVFQNNAKLEAEILNLREEICIYKQTIESIKSEKDYVTAKLQATLMENHRLKSTDPEEDQTSDIEPFQQEAVNLISKVAANVTVDDEESRVRLSEENWDLRREMVELESELVGARLDNVYLDKELAGRIQQIQLLASTTPPEVKERLWTQIEAEMSLQRAKTIAQICKTKQEVKEKRRLELKEAAILKDPIASRKLSSGGSFTEDHSHARGKQVMVLKNPADDLGMAIIGGSEHNLPIIVSEVFQNSAVARSHKLKAGDIILSVNGTDFTAIGHQEAVTFLSSLRGQITFELQGAETVSEDDPSNLDFRFYRLFESEPDSPRHRSADPVPQVKEQPGRAVSSVALERAPSVLGKAEEMPSVHSPRRDIEKLSLADTPQKGEPLDNSDNSPRDKSTNEERKSENEDRNSAKEDRKSAKEDRKSAKEDRKSAKPESEAMYSVTSVNGIAHV